MSGPESAFWVELRACMLGLWDAQRHEDQSPGVPDVSFCASGHDGWIELKTIPLLPKRATTTIKVPHLTAFQRSWLIRRARAGSAVFIFLKTPGINIWENKHYFLFDKESVPFVGKMVLKEMIQQAVYSEDHLDSDLLLKALTA